MSGGVTSENVTKQLFFCAASSDKYSIRHLWRLVAEKVQPERDGHIYKEDNTEYGAITSASCLAVFLQNYICLKQGQRKK